jgi:hypothetical protein
MPSHLTYTIPPITKLLKKVIRPGTKWLDPFANDNTIKRYCPWVITNDLNPEFNTDYHLEANDFLMGFSGVDGVLFDPPYSVRQLSECYQSIGKATSTELTRSDTWTAWRESINKCVRPGGIVVSFGWNTTGMGKEWFKKEIILIVSHGGIHNDTLVTVERKIPQRSLDDWNPSNPPWNDH